MIRMEGRVRKKEQDDLGESPHGVDVAVHDPLGMKMCEGLRKSGSSA